MKLLFLFILALRAESPPLKSSAPAIEEKEIDCQGKKLPGSYFNDDYCDCPDGSDEPGTAACAPIGKFKCENIGHVPKWIKSSLVQDGICDCCDGSDEKNSIWVKCQNTCREESEEYRKEQEAKREKFSKGMERRKLYIQEFKKLSEQRTADLKDLEKSVVELERKEDSLKVLEKQKGEIAEKERLLMCKAFLNKVRGWLNDLDKSLESLLAVEPHTMESVHFEIIQEEEMNAKEEIKDIKGSDSQKMEDWESPELSKDDYEKFADDDYSPPPYEIPNDENDWPCKSYSDKASGWVQTLLDSIKYNHGQSTTDSEAIKSHINAKNDLVKLSNDISKKKRKLENIKEKAKLDYGPSGVFLALESKCFSFDAGTYSYEMCFFGAATQRFTGTVMNLGTWSRWSGPPENLYSEALFEHGTSCWNGPERSMRVRLSCGPEEKIISVVEPAKCAYLMDMETAALCSDEKTLAQENDIRHIDL